MDTQRTHVKYKALRIIPLGRPNKAQHGKMSKDGVHPRAVVHVDASWRAVDHHSPNSWLQYPRCRVLNSLSHDW